AGVQQLVPPDGARWGKTAIHAPGDGKLSLRRFPKPLGSWDNNFMRNSKTISSEARSQLVRRLQEGDEREIRAYVSTLRQSITKYAQPLDVGRKLIDDAMKSASLTDLLHEIREQ